MAKVAISRSKLWKSKSKFKGKVRRYGGVRRPLSNKFVFRRAGQEQTIQNTGPGTIALTNTGINGWAVSTPAADANNLFQFGMAFQGRLDQCQAFTDFTTLFDRYKISGIKVKFIPLTTQATLNTAVPMLAYAIDLDDASVPGEYIYSGSGSRIGRIDGQYVYNGSGSRIGRIDGDYLYNGSGSRIGRLDGDYLYNGSGSRIGRADGLRRMEIILFFYFFM